MRKLLLIALKDVPLIFRDRSALVLMLLAPFLLTIGMGAITGRFSGSTSGVGDIPVVIVTQGQGQLGQLAPRPCHNHRVFHPRRGCAGYHAGHFYKD